jgi:hypothetical protein
MKRGVSYLIVSMILVLILVGIGYAFIFQEYFGQEELDYQSCRQSVLLRSSLPEEDLGVAVASGKEAFDLKCKANVLNIDYKDVKKAEEEIGKEIASCWFLYGKGEIQFFPKERLVLGDTSPCMICSRIHVDKEFVDFYNENEINIQRALMEREVSPGETYYEYLNPNDEGGAFDYLKGWKSEFEIDKDIEITGGSETSGGFYFKSNLDSSGGDLFVIFSQPSRESFGDTIHDYVTLVPASDLPEVTEDWLYAEFTGIGSVRYPICTSINIIPS